MNRLVELAYKPRKEWEESARALFSQALEDRFLRIRDLVPKKNDESRFQLRVNPDQKEGSAAYAALIPPNQELSGAYGGMSFVMFPADDARAPALIAMVVGTNGLAPDEGVLGRPGHARKCAAIASWLNSRLPGSAWAKRDPVRIDIDLPRSAQFSHWEAACKKYGKVIYATFIPPTEPTERNKAIVRDAITALIDLFFDERRIDAKKGNLEDQVRITREWMSRILPATTDQDVAATLERRRFAIIEGPPGTGKTEMARRLLREKYSENGKVIQFHPGTTYEAFIGGLAPRDGGALGFTFKPVRGQLMDAVVRARKEPQKKHLLVIDEINRADLAKVLGEAIYLFEPDQADRSVTLAHDFEEIGRSLTLPMNLHVLGTMNSADRSIAILDVAVRRRFAFLQLWPQLSVVAAGSILAERFEELLKLFIEYANDDALPLTPGHAYFLAKPEDAGVHLQTAVRPLLEEYLAQGYVAGFADEIRAFLDRIAQVA